MQTLTSEQTALISSDDGSKVDTISKDFKEAVTNEENADSALGNKTEEIENISSESKMDFSEENTSDLETDASRNDFNIAENSLIEDDKPMISDAHDTTPEAILPDSDKSVINQPEDLNQQEAVNAPAMADPLPVEIRASEVVILKSGDVVETQEDNKEAVSWDQQEAIGSLNEIDSLQETEPIGKEKDGGQNGEVEKSETNFEKTEGSFSRAGIPAPSLVPDLQVPPGNVLVPAVVDQSQHQAFAALQALKVCLSFSRNPERPKASNSLYICWY